MRTHALILFCLCAALPAGADCYADYKAKQDDPLRLAYGVAKIDGPCSVPSARTELSGRLERAGWTLLTVLGTFDESGLAERQSSAGDHYLSF